MNGPVVTATQHGEVAECCRTAVGPVPDVMTLAEPDAGAGKATAAVAVVECAT
jgi:hypothetical protein